jgi:hypothetical protein
MFICKAKKDISKMDVNQFKTNISEPIIRGAYGNQQNKYEQLTNLFHRDNSDVLKSYLGIEFH